MILFAGLFVGGLMANWKGRDDKLARFGWFLCGAVPGASLLVKEPRFMFMILLFLGLLIWRHQWRIRRMAS